MNRIGWTLIVAGLLSGWPQVMAQSLNVPLNRQFASPLERHFGSGQQRTHAAYLPVLEEQVGWDTLYRNQLSHWPRKEHATWFGRKLRQESLITVDSGIFHVVVDPLFNFEVGRDRKDGTDVNYYTNTRGFRVRGRIGKRFAFESAAYENQARLPGYIDDFVGATGVVPGQGRAKIFKETGRDWSRASGYISYSPTDFINLQFGHGKHFIGHGYRSLLLSDNTFNYPYLRGSVRFLDDRFQYTLLYTWLSSVDRVPEATTPEASFQRKAGTFHYLSFAPTPWLELGVFEGVIWQRWDSTGTTSFDGNFVNPVLGVNSLVKGTNDLDNVVLGGNLKVQPFRQVSLYGQFVYDHSSRGGYQVGAKLHDLFGIYNLHVQGEFNTVDPFTYAHRTPLQNYGHYGQPLAHPLGANFDELVGIARYRWRDFFAEVQVNMASYDDDPAGQNFGRNIFNSTDLVGTTQEAPVPVDLRLQQVRIGYVINPTTNWQVLVGVLNRQEERPDVTLETQYIYLSMRTSLVNYYYDF
ncbi:MAG: capsule assembly Wzi family protein [Bacteroidota bacterium]